MFVELRMETKRVHENPHGDLLSLDLIDVLYHFRLVGV